MVPDSTVDALAEAVLEQAQAEAKQIMEGAQAAAQKLINEAQEEAARQRELANLAETARAERENASAIAAARLEARRRILEAREELIGRVFDEVKKRLEVLRSEPSYRLILAQLVQEGIAALEGEHFIVAVSAQDYKVATQALGLGVVEGKQIELKADEQLHDGGCVVRQSDGSSLYDNTFTSIIARHRLRLRAPVAECLWGKGKRWEDL